MLRCVCDDCFRTLVRSSQHLLYLGLGTCALSFFILTVLPQFWWGAGLPPVAWMGRLRSEDSLHYFSKAASLLSFCMWLLTSFCGLCSCRLVLRVLAMLLPVRAGKVPLGWAWGSWMLSPLPHFARAASPVLWTPGGSSGHRPLCPASHGTWFSSPEALGLSAFSFPCQGPFVVSVGLCPGRRSWEMCPQHPLLELDVHRIFSVKAGTIIGSLLWDSLASSGCISSEKAGGG